MPNTPTQQTSPSEASSSRNPVEILSVAGNVSVTGHKSGKDDNCVFVVAKPALRQVRGLHRGEVSADEWIVSRFAIPVTTGASERV